MNLKEQRAAAIAEAREIQAKAGVNMSNEDFAAVKAALDKVDALDAEIKAAEERNAVIGRMKALDTTPEAKAPEAPARTLGEHFVKSAGDILAKQAGGAQISASAPEFIKEASDPHATPANLVDGWGTTYERSIVNARRERLVAADLMGSATVTSATVKYLVEKATRLKEGAPAAVLEGGKKPYVRFDDFEIVSESITKLAALTKLTDEMIADYGFVADYINSQLIYELSVVEEKQLLNGDGSSGNLKGLLQRDGIQTAEAASADKWFDTIYSAIAKIPLATNLTADGLLINPADYEALRLQKDGNEQYLAGGPFQGQYGNGGILVDPPVWGLRTVVTNAVEKGTAVVGAFRQGATVLRKGGLRVDSTNTNVDDFEKNLVTLRAEERLGLMVPVPAAFVKVTLSA